MVQMYDKNRIKTILFDNFQKEKTTVNDIFTVVL